MEKIFLKRLLTLKLFRVSLRKKLMQINSSTKFADRCYSEFHNLGLKIYPLESKTQFLLSSSWLQVSRKLRLKFGKMQTLKPSFFKTIVNFSANFVLFFSFIHFLTFPIHTYPYMMRHKSYGRKNQNKKLVKIAGGFPDRNFCYASYYGYV